MTPDELRKLAQEWTAQAGCVVLGCGSEETHEEAMARIQDAVLPLLTRVATEATHCCRCGDAGEVACGLPCDGPIPCPCVSAATQRERERIEGEVRRAYSYILARHGVSQGWLRDEILRHIKGEAR